MRKHLSRIAAVLSLFLLTSCSKTDSYDQSMQKVKEAIVERKFEQAEGFAEMASESRPKDDKAQTYLKHIQLYLEALENKEAKENEKAINKFQDIIEITGGSDKLVRYAENEKVKLEKLDTDSSKKDVEKEGKKEEQVETVWNVEKSEKLKIFMEQFSKVMGQNYKNYSQPNNVDLYGLLLPDAIFNGDMQLAIESQPVEVEWSETGEGKASYQLVAVYSDAETQPYLAKHVYFFVIQSGTPKVLLTQQNQGNNENYLYFNETENEVLINGFNSIVNGEQAVMTEKKKQSDTNITAKEFAMLYAGWSGEKYPIMHHDEYIERINGKDTTNEELTAVITYIDRDENTLQCAVDIPSKMSSVFYTFDKQAQKVYLNHNTAGYAVEDAKEFTQYIQENK